MKLLIDGLGWAGSFLVLIAYGLNITGRLNSGTVRYILLNLVGSIFLIIYATYYAAFANTFINVVWAVVALITLVRAKRK